MTTAGKTYRIKSTSHEFLTMSWWAASASDTDELEMVGEESGHRVIWGLRAGAKAVSAPINGSFVSASVSTLGDTVGIFNDPAMLLQLELHLPRGITIDQVISEAAARYKAHFAQNGIDIYYTRKNYEEVQWKRLGTVPNRRISSVSLAGGIETDLLVDARNFLDPATEALYTSFGRPYKRVYCLHGPPGCGKTSLVMAIASELSRPVAIFNVDSLRDDTFIELISDLPDGAVIIFEDIDAMFKSRVPQGPQGKVGGGGIEDGGMTFSTLLNSLDGVLHPRKALIFMTTNHLERLDPALHRPGRVDRMVEVPYARSAQVANLWKIAFPKGPAMPRELVRAADAGKGVSPALTSEVLFTRRTEGPAATAAALLTVWGANRA